MRESTETIHVHVLEVILKFVRFCVLSWMACFNFWGTIHEWRCMKRIDSNLFRLGPKNS